MDIKDFGEWRVPGGWNELTLGQLMEIQSLTGEGSFDVRACLHILCGKSEEEVGELPVEFAEELLGQLVWLKTDLPEVEPKTEIEVGGELFVVDTEKSMKTGEYIQLDSILRTNPGDYASLLAILARKPGEEYDSKFEAEKFDERREMFLGANALDCLSVMGFFLRCWNVSELISRLYLEVEENLGAIRRSIETSGNLGAFGRRYMRWRLARLERLIESSLPS